MSAQYMVKRMAALMEQHRLDTEQIQALKAEIERLRKQLDADMEHEFMADGRRGRDRNGRHTHPKGQSE